MAMKYRRECYAIAKGIEVFRQMLWHELDELGESYNSKL